jgi:NADH-quinone oxidoreductase subunit F
MGSGYSVDIWTHKGAGAYICGEESALLESLEGKRGYPRNRPPFPAIVGAFGCPTVINNVETLANVPHILNRGAAWYKAIGPEKSPGTKLVCVSGHVNKPGLYELPMGTPMKEIIYDIGGGILGGKTLKGVIPGGSSFPVLNKDEAERAIFDFDSMRTIGSAMGSGVVIVMHEDTCMIDMLLATARFYHHESCGQCTPCREGTGWIEKIMTECSTTSPTTWSAIRFACSPIVSRCRSRAMSPSFATNSKRTSSSDDVPSRPHPRSRLRD